jgi:hypothetical protein
MGVLKAWDGLFWRIVGCGDFEYTDPFSSAGALGPPWHAPDGSPADWTVAGGVAQWNGSGSSYALIDIGAESVDVTIDVTSTLLGSGSINVGAVWNWRDSAHFHALQINGNALALYKIDGGATVLHSETGSGLYGSGLYRVNHQLDGAIELVRNGISIWTSTSPLHDQAPYAGLYGDNTTPAVNAFTITGRRPRLKAWDGSRWLTEACEGKGRPLRLDISSTWTDAVCMAAPYSDIYSDTYE